MSEDYLALKPVAMWNSVRGVWEKPETVSLLCEHLELFSETWPTSGIMLAGKVYERPTPVHLTSDSESLLLPIPLGPEQVPLMATPTTGEAVGPSLSTSGGENLRTQVAILSGRFDGELLRTPAVSDIYYEGYERAITKKSPNRGVGLPTWAERIKLLRTPTAAEVEGGPVHPDVAKAKGQTLRLTSQVLNLLPTPTTQEGSGKCRDYRSDMTHALTCECKRWADFTPAIERWERVTGRKAPEPTLPDGQKGQHRLSSKFTEWLMGVPDGWITGHGLHRKDEIKAAGNGVVPQQALLALQIMNQGVESE